MGGTTHGRTKTRIYRIWMSMIGRCKYEYTNDYHRYGGRGIQVCKRWLSFDAFYEDMGEPPTSEHTLDRRNGDGNYSKPNCKWSTRSEQQRNRSTNRLLTFRGETAPLIVWAERYGIRKETLRKRIITGMSVGEALKKPIQNYRRTIRYRGRDMVVAELASVLGISASTMRRRMAEGWTDEELLLPSQKQKSK